MRNEGSVETDDVGAAHSVPEHLRICEEFAPGHFAADCPDGGTGNGAACTQATQTCTGGTIQGTGSHGVSLATVKNIEFLMIVEGPIWRQTSASFLDCRMNYVSCGHHQAVGSDHESGSNRDGRLSAMVIIGIIVC